MSWYYKVELEPGVYSDGRPQPTMALSRRLLGNVDLKGTTCLDIGSMEGVIPLLMAKAGAKRVVASDRILRKTKMEQLMTAYGHQFQMQAYEQVDDLSSRLDSTFDFVNFSGVMYHSLNPLGILASARSLCRVGGLMIVETAVVQGDDDVLHFEPRRLGEARYFYPTTAFFEKMCHLVGLAPLRVVYLGRALEGQNLRVALLCRSLGGPLVRFEDLAWFSTPRVHYDLCHESTLDFSRLHGQKSELGLFPPTGVHDIEGKIGLNHLLKTLPSIKPDEEESTLGLDAD